MSRREDVVMAVFLLDESDQLGEIGLVKFLL